MTDQTKANPDGSTTEEPKAPSVEDLQKQIENLNKGIATYRGEAKTALDRAEAAETSAKALKEAIEGKDKKKDEDAPALSPEDAKRLEAWAKSQGFATKDEILQERARIQGETLKGVETQAIDEFIKLHPEYEKDENWEKLKSEFGQYKLPTNIVDYRRILNKIHKELNPGDDEGKARARAEIETRKRLGLGGGSQRSSDEEMTAEKLQERYPRLSREQIQTRMAEIKALYPDKK